MSPSFNHSYLAYRIAKNLDTSERFNIHITVHEMTEKFEVYLQAGVQSCWLVIPPTKTVVVFHDIQQPRSYSTGQISDSVINFDVAVEEIFAS